MVCTQYHVRVLIGHVTLAGHRVMVAQFDAGTSNLDRAYEDVPQQLKTLYTEAA